METSADIAGLRATLDRFRQKGARIGFVPTMGNLHAGHISLIEQSVSRCDFTVASIFVNPLQFGAGEDFDTYPRTLADDQSKLVEAGCNLLFTPSTDQLYPRGLEAHTKVTVPEVTRHHCGAHRPGHFDGVSTIVNVLLNIVQPAVAFFGEKDFQQVAVIRKLVFDLQMPVEIVSGATRREDDGLAMSSRNQYLSAEDRPVAAELYRTLQHIASRIEDGEKNFLQLQTEGLENLSRKGFRTEYLNIVRADTLDVASERDEDIVVLVAARLGQTRLIDNIRIIRSHD
ncbi:pantoate--beta-alanine ligase [Allohahella marinimesophila]